VKGLLDSKEKALGRVRLPEGMGLGNGPWRKSGKRYSIENTIGQFNITIIDTLLLHLNHCDKIHGCLKR
jgi:hypothetical protein